MRILLHWGPRTRSCLIRFLHYHKRFLTRRVVPVRTNCISDIPYHAGIWGLARALRAERPDLKVVCLDLPDMDHLFEAGLA